jgi:hypothetical protein
MFNLNKQQLLLIQIFEISCGLQKTRKKQNYREKENAQKIFNQEEKIMGNQQNYF